MKRNPDYPNYAEFDEVVADIFCKQLQDLIYEARRHGIRLRTEPVVLGMGMGRTLDHPHATPLRIGLPGDAKPLP